MVTLDEVLATVRESLYLPDPTALYVVLGTYAANRIPGDPVWTLLVGPPSAGKTELLHALHCQHDTHAVSTFTEAGLLSGSQSRSSDATGGLLDRLGTFGVLVCKDFTSFLSEGDETRAGLMAALREIYDGAWTRHLGSSGGHSREWHGKVGLIGGVTDVIDAHIDVLGEMGPRFCFYRLPDLTYTETQQAIEVAAGKANRADAARDAIANVVHELLAGLDFDTRPADGPEPVIPELRDVAHFAAAARSPVPRDRWGAITFVPRQERPMRLYLQLVQLARGLLAIGLDDDLALGVLRTVALDGIPRFRRLVLEHVGAARAPTTRTIQDALGMDAVAIPNALEDLAALGLVNRSSETSSNEPHWSWAWPLDPATLGLATRHVHAELTR